MDGSCQTEVVAHAATLQQADILRAVLQSEGFDAFIIGERAANVLSPLQMGLNPHGIRIAVPADQAQDALSVLRWKHQDGLALPEGAWTANGPRGEEFWADGGEDAESRPAEPGEVVPSTADLDAERACLAALFSFWIWPLVPLTLWYIVRALVGAQKRGITGRATYRRNLALAVVGGVLLPAAVLCLILLLAR